MQAVNVWIARIFQAATRLSQRQAGTGLVEYALILVLVAIVAIGILATVGTDITNVFQQISDALRGASPAP